MSPVHLRQWQWPTNRADHHLQCGILIDKEGPVLYFHVVR
jgi:hypothetical protein